MCVIYDFTDLFVISVLLSPIGYVVQDVNNINAKEILSRNFEKKDMTLGAHDYFSLEKGIANYNEIYNKII